MEGGRAVDEGAAEKIGNKLKSSILKANIRIIASAETKESAEAILSENRIFLQSIYRSSRAIHLFLKKYMAKFKKTFP